jgi:hypothetical protein
VTTIHGYIRVKETNGPIPGLIVALFEHESGSAEITSYGKGMTHGSVDPLQDYTLSLGSTLTDEKGYFKLEVDPPEPPAKVEELAKGDPKQQSVQSVKTLKPRRDMMLAVLAPSTAENAHQVKVEPLSQRLLHTMPILQTQAGQSEACVIRLLEEQLKRFDISVTGAVPKISVEDSVQRLVKATQDSIRFKEAVRQELVPIRKAQLEKRRNIALNAKKFAGTLQAVPKAVRDSGTFVPRMRKVDLEEPAKKVSFDERVKEANYGVMKSFTDRMAYFNQAGLLPTRVFLNLPSVTYYAAMGWGVFGKIISDIVRSLPNETATVSLTQEQLCILMNGKRGGTQLLRVRDLLEDLKEERKALAATSARLAESETPTAGEEPTGETPEPGAETPTAIDLDNAAAAIGQRALGQVWDMPSQNGQPISVKRLFIGDGNLLWGSTPSSPAAEGWNPAVDLSQSLGQSPADVPAFHDFYHLQIAFKHIWTEAFDNNTRENIETLYETLAELQDEYNVDLSSLTELGEVQDVYDFLKTLEGIESTATTIEPITPEVLAIEAKLGCDPKTWFYLSPDQQYNVISIVQNWTRFMYDPANKEIHFLDRYVLDDLRAIFLKPEGALSRLARLRVETAMRMQDPYAFHYFAPNSVNFGLMLTYRQLWEPLHYQVGDLVSTIPLAPGEKRKFEAKQVVKRSRAEKEVENSLASRRGESAITQRADVEIANKASWQSNFKMTAEGSFRFAIGEISGTTEFALDQAQESSSVKKDFREAVIKAAEEYKQERTIEVSTTDELTTETTTSGEISNPNNEITVTYLLYELERQYSISERIHRVTPVILVAQDVPAPHEITENWLLTYEWILRRVLLDDSLAPALDYLTDAFAGEELSVSIKKVNWETQRELVETLQATVNELLTARARFRMQLVSTEESRARVAAMEEAQGWLSELVENLTYGDVGDLAVGEMEAKVNAIQKRLEYLEEGLGEEREQLALAREALEETTQMYTAALEAQTNRRVAIDQLRIHVKENILYYMQAIWDHEPPDQRFFRLYHVPVRLPQPANPTQVCRMRRATNEEMATTGLPIVERSGEYFIIDGCDPPTLPTDPADLETKQLVEIADLDHPLGYKGNYIIFPLKACVYLTNFMMREFFDDYFGVRDPDLTANFSAEELLQYAEQLLNDPESPLNNSSLPQEYRDAQREALNTLVMSKLQSPRRDSDIVVVPTGELFMEALLGKHALLEDFKMVHRGYDVAKVRAEVRQTELENLRRAARLLQADPNLEDPDIDKHIVVEGNAPVQITETP